MRKTKLLIGFSYVRQVSVGFIVNQSRVIGHNAENVLEKLKTCQQKSARFCLYDETFPKLGKRAFRNGVGKANMVSFLSSRIIKNKAKDITAQLSTLTGRYYILRTF